jgi:SAM-dependent methyltransferase
LDTQTLYDEDYFERGVEKGVSCYENYRWLGKPTFEYCAAVIDFLMLENGNTLLDFGCAKGYYTKAFRLLGIDACGSDISKYAINNCDPDISDWLTLIPEGTVWVPNDERTFHTIFCKDVLEHVEDLEPILRQICFRCNQVLIGVPLGDRGKYRVDRANKDKTHVYCWEKNMWADKLLEHFTQITFRYNIPSIPLREGDHKEGYGYFLCR